MKIVERQTGDGDGVTGRSSDPRRAQQIAADVRTDESGPLEPSTECRQPTTISRGANATNATGSTTDATGIGAYADTSRGVNSPSRPANIPVPFSQHQHPVAAQAAATAQPTNSSEETA